MRVIGGKWRGQPLEAPEGRAVTRPTTSRVRESIVSMVSSAFNLDLSSCSVLDAFAGSGAVGIELLSRGARHVTFIDQDREAVRRIRRNLNKVRVDKESYTVLAGSTGRLIGTESPAGAPFDAVFLDPPYRMEAAQVAQIVDTTRKNYVLTPRCVVVYERARKGAPLPLENAQCEKSKRYGSTVVELWRLEES